MIGYRFVLYVTGRSGRSQRAIETMSRLCEGRLRTNYDLRVVDVSETPETARSDHVLVTPTVVRLLPPPERRVVGDLGDGEQAWVALGLAGEGPGDQGGNT